MGEPTVDQLLADAGTDSPEQVVAACKHPLCEWEKKCEGMEFVRKERQVQRSYKRMMSEEDKMDQLLLQQAELVDKQSELRLQDRQLGELVAIKRQRITECHKDWATLQVKFRSEFLCMKCNGGRSPFTPR